jgi:hypothetical protein
LDGHGHQIVTVTVNPIVPTNLHDLDSSLWNPCSNDTAENDGVTDIAVLLIALIAIVIAGAMRGVIVVMVINLCVASALIITRVSSSTVPKPGSWVLQERGHPEAAARHREEAEREARGRVHQSGSQ